ncbi:hypothetical protein Clacol_000548 [Clathrus columnatus]|uniref:Rab-GAP TBC domain-containing protein n=1 Tax=Clathrus columnatus TaxID=1419009 RepID=A0AAV4ZZ07_9AGAM|nr:hypothetical protein Clacol_000548 [Clathrus columnatus]
MSTTSPRPPPTRPHVALNPPSNFATYNNLDWGEDDAWDSTSDSESVVPVTVAPTRSTAVAVPKRSNANSSNSTLSFSYTHISAPSPSSYPSERGESLGVLSKEAESKAGWTIVTKTNESATSKDHSFSPSSKKNLGTVKTLTKFDEKDIDEEIDMVVGDLEQEHRLVSRPINVVKTTADEILKDSFYNLLTNSKKSRSSNPNTEPSITPSLQRELSIRANRRRKFDECLLSQDINIAELRKLAWSGIPNDLRPIVWQLLSGYLPLSNQMRLNTLQRKREEYMSLVEAAFVRGRDGLDQQIWHQIEIDVPRTRPGVRLWMEGTTQRCLERILYVWAIRHPASDSDPEDFDPGVLKPEILNAIEADTFWCLSRLLDGIQDNYISAQPGIQRSIKRMAELVSRIDAPLYAHLHSENVEFMQFAFRWMNCLLMREISVRNTIRMWDTYLAEGPDAFSQFHLYVCAAFLVKWSEKLRDMDFQGIIMFLQSLPTQGWTDHDVELLLSEAFLLNSVWHHAQSHFIGKSPTA